MYRRNRSQEVLSEQLPSLKTQLSEQQCRLPNARRLAVLLKGQTQPPLVCPAISATDGRRFGRLLIALPAP